MRILLINNYISNTGGSEVCTYATGKLLRRKGNEAYFFASDRGPYLEEDYKYAKYFPKDIDYKSLSTLELFKHSFRPFYNIEAGEKLNLLINEIKPDIAHVNCLSFILTPSVLNACYKNNVPIIMTLHGPQLMCPAVKMMYRSEEYCHDEHCLSGSPLSCITNKCLDKSLIKSAGIASEFIFRKIHRLYDKVSVFISPSQALLDLAVRSGINKEKLVLINNFVDDEKFLIQPEYRDKGYFLYVGRLSREKGVHYLLEAMSKLPEEIRLHIVGMGQEDENLKRQARDLNLNNVSFLGFKSGKELEEEYKNCIATVLPCNWFENLPTTVIESFVYGKPVIGSNIGGIPEMLENSRCGITFEPGNIDKLLKAIYRLYEDKNLTVEMGKNGREKAERQYNSETHYSKLIKVYKSVF